MDLIAGLLANIAAIIKHARYRSRRNPRHRCNFLDARLSRILRTSALASHSTLPHQHVIRLHTNKAYPNKSGKTVTVQVSKRLIQIIRRVPPKGRLHRTPAGPLWVTFQNISAGRKGLRRAKRAAEPFACPRTFWKVTQSGPAILRELSPFRTCRGRYAQ